ncbi:MAG: ABC transporter ATP-binding protein [Myxococcota bacterium]
MTAATPSASPEPLDVSFRDVHLSLGGRRIFSGLSCGFPRSRISVVLGASGGGKSTLLRAMGGLVRPQRGTIEVVGQPVTDPRADLKAIRRRLGMMFQGGALLDSMSVFENLALPLREQGGLDRQEITNKVCRQLESVGLMDASTLLPGQLSGGMVKRAALARSMVADPEILLCDEPFSGLDPISLRTVEHLLEEVNKESGVTMIITSHHIPSSLRMASHIVFLHDHRAVEGPPEALRRCPVPEIREFIAAEDPRSEEPAPGEPPASGAGA